MKLLTFQARHFQWKAHSPGVEGVSASFAYEEANEAVVAWIHVEAVDAENRARVLRYAVKHIKWIANKKRLTNIVLHSFAHLGGDSAEPAIADTFLQQLAERLRRTGYNVKLTPFGFFCEWTLDVYGGSLAKVFKAI